MATVYQSTTGQVVIGLHELERLIAKVNDAADGDLFPVLDAIGQQQEDAARRRIRETKRGPDGARWKPWSVNYRKSRKPQHSLLVGEGALADSMDHQVVGRDAVEVGSPMIYAGRHLYGDESLIGPVRGGGRIPARPFLDTDGGFADSHDRDELRRIIRSFLGGMLR